VSVNTGEILELIYAAPACQHGWDGVLHRFAALTDSIAAGITIEDPLTRQGRPITYFGFDSGHVEKTFDHYLPMNPLFKIAHAMTTGFIVGNGDVIDPMDFVKTDFYNGWARPQGIGSPLTLVLNHSETFYCPLTLVRPDGKGEAPPEHRQLLRFFSSHLSCAMTLHMKLDTAEAKLQICDAVFHNANLALFILDAKGQLTFCSRLAEIQLEKAGELTASGKMLRCSNDDNDRLLKAAITKASNPVMPVGSQFRLARVSGAPLVVSVTPIVRSLKLAEPGLSSSCCAIIVSEPDVQLALTTQKLAQTYGLTKAEMRLLDAILKGKGIGQAAETVNISVETARTHIKRILSKTGTSRQTELMRLFIDEILNKNA
jgi:DNA-binding CsgD family transcriptional regulator